jgi:hypothetical protein
VFGGSRAHLPRPWHSLVVGSAFSVGGAHLPLQMLVVGGAFGGDGAASGVIPFGGSRAHLPPQMLVVGGASGGGSTASGVCTFGRPAPLFGGPSCEASFIGQSLCEVR